MENKALQVFNNPEFGSVRTVVIDEEPWFIGADVATALGYTNPRKALGDHVDGEDKNTVTIRDGIKGNPNKTVINESGMYGLIISSKLPTAKKFKHWVTSEVLPDIRKHGLYAKQSVLTTLIPVLSCSRSTRKRNRRRNGYRLSWTIAKNGIPLSALQKSMIFRGKASRGANSNGHRLILELA